MNENDNQKILNILQSSDNSIYEVILNSNFLPLFQKSIEINDQNQLVQYIFSHIEDLYEIFYSNNNPSLKQVAFSIICSSNYDFREQLIKNSNIIKLLQDFPKSSKKEVQIYVETYMLIISYYIYDKNGDIDINFLSKSFFLDLFFLIKYDYMEDSQYFSFSSLLFNNSPQISLLIHQVSFLNLLVSNIKSTDIISLNCMKLIEKSFNSSYSIDMFYALTFQDDISRIINIGIQNQSFSYFDFFTHLITICNLPKFQEQLNSKTIFLLLSSLFNEISKFLLSYKNFTEYERSLFDFISTLLIENFHSKINPNFLEYNLSIYFEILEFSMNIFFDFSTNSFLHNSSLKLFTILIENSLISHTIFWKYFSFLPGKILNSYESHSFFPYSAHLKVISKLISPFLGFSFPNNENFIFQKNQNLINLCNEKINDKNFEQKWSDYLLHNQKILELSYTTPQDVKVSNNNNNKKKKKNLNNSTKFHTSNFNINEKDKYIKITQKQKLSFKENFLNIIHHPFKIRIFIEDIIEFHRIFFYLIGFMFLVVILLYKYKF